MPVTITILTDHSVLSRMISTTRARISSHHVTVLPSILLKRKIGRLQLENYDLRPLCGSNLLLTRVAGIPAPSL